MSPEDVDTSADASLERAILDALDSLPSQEVLVRPAGTVRS